MKMVLVSGPINLKYRRAVLTTPKCRPYAPTVDSLLEVRIPHKTQADEKNLHYNMNRKQTDHSNQFHFSKWCTSVLTNYRQIRMTQLLSTLRRTHARTPRSEQYRMIESDAQLYSSTQSTSLHREPGVHIHTAFSTSWLFASSLVPSSGGLTL